MRNKNRKPEGINSIVKKVIGEIETKNPDTKEKILNIWQKAVGSEARHHSRPVSIRRKVLTIEVDSSTWMYALSLKKRFILKDLKKGLGEKKLRDIRFRMGDIT